MKKPEVQPESPPDPLHLHQEAHQELERRLADYRVLSTELEDFASKKILTIGQAEEELDLQKLDALTIRIRSLELREKSISHKTHEIEKWLQASLIDHIERLERLTDYLNQKLAREATSQLLAHFPGPGDLLPTLEQLGVKTRFYLENTVRPPALSWAWRQPLEGTSQKFTPPGVAINDPIWAPAKRADVVKNLLDATESVLGSEQLVFARLKSEKDVPAFAKPEAATTDISQYLGWNKPVRISPVSGAIEQQERIA